MLLNFKASTQVSGQRGSGIQINPVVWRDGADATNDQAGAQSPFGLWGALGSRGARDIIDQEF
ncbi:hypothetical protein RBSWK_01525 [Rhodopirellula baltica SWK14]|uniref:Protein containing DUF1559 n=1 Tax=Rhodopirellula baltica SWK14 TaxID=993516 RepID=L7CL12_RHOBT|nr:hypothetical protein RBSWK_01525 [Rhodopirellula baltica SWK14]